MRRQLVPTSAFLRDLKRLRKSQPQLTPTIQQALACLAEDPHTPALRTHKLTGMFKDTWSCSVAYDLRILFQFAGGDEKDPEGAGEVIVLLAVGTHDQVY